MLSCQRRMILVPECCCLLVYGHRWLLQGSLWMGVHFMGLLCLGMGLRAMLLVLKSIVVRLWKKQNMRRSVFLMVVILPFMILLVG